MNLVTQYLQKQKRQEPLSFEEEQVRQAHVKQLLAIPKNERLALSISWYLVSHPKREDS